MGGFFGAACNHDAIEDVFFEKEPQNVASKIYDFYEEYEKKIDLDPSCMHAFAGGM
jgi:hypothetical protein